MRVFAAIFLFVTAAQGAVAQQNVSKQTADSRLPKTVCRYDRLSGLRRVIAEPSIEELTHFDLSVLTQPWVSFRIGTIVSVSRQKGPWSCVSASEETWSGSLFRSGWMKSSLLGPLEAQGSKPGTKN
jgi:hypothetical protein